MLLATTLALAVAAAAPPAMDVVWTVADAKGSGPFKVDAPYGAFYRFHVHGCLWPFRSKVDMDFFLEAPPRKGEKIFPVHLLLPVGEHVSGPWDGSGQHLVLAGDGTTMTSVRGAWTYHVRYDLTFDPAKGRYVGTRQEDQASPQPFVLAPLQR